MSTKKVKNPGLKTALEVGAGVAALAGVAAGAYLFAGPKGKENRKKVKAFADKVEKQVIVEFKKAKVVNEAAYKKIAAIAAKQYGEIQKMDKQEVAAALHELHSRWKTVQNAVQKAVKVPVKKAVAKKKIDAKSRR